jgi:hypothetical protein
MGVERRTKKPMVNTRTCPRCGAKPGTQCFVLTSKVFRELRVTHTRSSVRQDKYKGGRG